MRNEEPKASAAQSAVGRKRVVSRKLKVESIIAGMNSRLHKYALQSSAPKFSILNSQFSIKNRLLVTSYSLLVKEIPHSSFLIPHSTKRRFK